MSFLTAFSYIIVIKGIDEKKKRCTYVFFPFPVDVNRATNVRHSHVIVTIRNFFLSNNVWPLNLSPLYKIKKVTVKPLIHTTAGTIVINFIWLATLARFKPLLYLTSQS